MDLFDAEILNNLPDSYSTDENFIRDIATVHAELLFIHPFREGNGRTARLLANLMAHKQGYESLNFTKINESVLPEYISAVQAAAKKDYEPMVKIIELVF
jgi:cell filamentation protein